MAIKLTKTLAIKKKSWGQKFWGIKKILGYKIKILAIKLKNIGDKLKILAIKKFRDKMQATPMEDGFSSPTFHLLKILGLLTAKS